MANTSKKTKDNTKNLFATVASEVKKIKWPKKKEILSSTIKVLIFCVLFAIFFVVCDSLASGLIVAIGVGK